MNKNIDYLVTSYTEKENHYVFEQTLRVLKDVIIKVDKQKKVVVFPNFTIQFCCDEEYERKGLHTLRAKELGGLFFADQLDDYEKLKRGATMTKEQFIKLLENAETDEKGNLYYIDNSVTIKNRVYFATVTTICADFVKTYCYDDGKECYRYDRHFTSNDDTFDLNIVKKGGKQ